MLLGKRKEKLIRDLAAMVFTAVDSATARIAHSRREALEREEVERIAAIVVEAIKADRIEWTTPGELPIKHARFYRSKTGKCERLLIESTGDRGLPFWLVAHLSDAVPYVFKRGTVVECEAAWPDALEWMEKRFPEPEPKPEPDPKPRLQFDETFGDLITGNIGRLIIESEGSRNAQFRLIAYLGSGTEDFHVFKRGTVVECETAWPKAWEWMEKRFPENKA